MPGRSDPAAHGVTIDPASIKAARSGTVHLVSFITVSPASVWVSMSWSNSGELAPAAVSRSLRKQEGQRELQLPVGPELRLDDIVVTPEARLDWLLADLEELVHAAAQGQCPRVAAVGFPICRDDRRGDQRPAAGQVVVDEGLHQKLIDVETVVVSRKGPRVSYQSAVVPRWVTKEKNGGRACPPFSGSERVVGRGIK